jgi:hypothetical protein
MAEAIIEQTFNKSSERFEKTVQEYNSKHNRVTGLIEKNWATRMGKFVGQKNEDGTFKIKPFVTVEIHYRDYEVYAARYSFEKTPNAKMLRTGFESLWEHFIDHSKTMAMIKFQHFYDQNNKQEPQQEVAKSNLILLK